MKFKVRVCGISEYGEKFTAGEGEIEASNREAAHSLAIEQFWDMRFESASCSPEVEVLWEGEPSFVIYSKCEAAGGAGFWSNELGWVDLDDADRFSEQERQTLRLPQVGPAGAPTDAKWLPMEDALKLLED